MGRAKPVAHWITCREVAPYLEREFGADATGSEREIRAVAADAAHPLASVIAGRAEARRAATAPTRWGFTAGRIEVHAGVAAKPDGGKAER